MINPDLWWQVHTVREKVSELFNHTADLRDNTRENKLIYRRAARKMEDAISALDNALSELERQP